MKNLLKSALTVTTLLLCFSFTINKSDGLNAIYGVSEGDPSKIELNLTKDYKFTYQDFSSANNKIEIKGTYTLNNNKIELKCAENQVKFHHKWKISKNGEVAKSRKGLTYYTLQKK